MNRRYALLSIPALLLAVVVGVTLPSLGRAQDPAPVRRELEWKTLKSRLPTFRARIPGGWLVRAQGTGGMGITFVPDPAHNWDGGSAP